MHILFREQWICAPLLLTPKGLRLNLLHLQYDGSVAPFHGEKTHISPRKENLTFWPAKRKRPRQNRGPSALFMNISDRAATRHEAQSSQCA